MPLAKEFIVQVSGVERPNVIAHGGEFLLTIEGGQHVRQEFVQVRELVDPLGGRSQWW